MPLDPETFDALIDTVRRFVAERLRPLEAKVAEEDEVPDEIVARDAGDGAVRPLHPRGIWRARPHHGGGVPGRARVRPDHARPSARSSAPMSASAARAWSWPAPTSRRPNGCRGIACGEIITSFALTEPDAGSDSASVQTRAVRDGDVYLLTGTKRFITNADKADAVHGDGADRRGRARSGVSAFLVPADLPGVAIGKPEKKMGQQGAHVCDVNFDEAPVPAANRLGEEGEGFKIAMRVLDRGRLHISAVCVGVAERLIADCVAYATERKQFGKPLADFQLIQAMIADCKTEAMAARALVLETAALQGRRASRSRWRPRPPNISPARWSAASPTAPCRSSAAPAISPITASSGSIATSACSASTRAPARSSSWSSPARRSRTAAESNGGCHEEMDDRARRWRRFRGAGAGAGPAAARRGRARLSRQSRRPVRSFPPQSRAVRPRGADLGADGAGAARARL